MKKTLFSIFLVLILSLGGVGNASAEVQAPNLSIGDTWKYSVNLALSGLIGEAEEGLRNVTLQGTITMMIDSNQTVEVLNRSYDVWVIGLEGDFDIEFTYTIPDVGTFLMHAPAEGEGTIFLDNESFEYVKASLSVSAKFRRYSLFFELLVEAETSLNVSADNWNFPYDVGSVGNTSGHGVSYAHYVAKVNGAVVEENETRLSYEYDSSYECIEHRNVTVEAGDFQAYKVNVSSPGMYFFFGSFEGHRHEFYSNGVNNNVIVEVYGSEGGLLGEWSLDYYAESPPEVSNGLESLLILLVVVIVMILILIAILVSKRKSRKEETDDTEYFGGREVCRRCGSEIPKGQTRCPSCGRAIW
ncbi:MAG: zinc ribbon domain-containing protein [Thermoplasmata archaeon]